MLTSYPRKPGKGFTPSLPFPVALTQGVVAKLEGLGALGALFWPLVTHFGRSRRLLVAILIPTLQKIASNVPPETSRASQNVPNPWIFHAFSVCVFDAYRMLLQDAYNIANPQKYQKTIGKTMVFDGFPRIGHIKQT